MMPQTERIRNAADLTGDPVVDAVTVYTEADLDRMRDDPLLTRQYFWRVAMEWRRAGMVKEAEVVLGNLDAMVESCR